MDFVTCVARQPIFDRNRRIFGYEVLYRSAASDEKFDHRDGDQASVQVMHGTLNVLGLQQIVGQNRMFINITRRGLVTEEYTVLPPDRAVIELLETVEPDQQVIDAATRLKAAGYQLALDDFQFDPRYDPLLQLADIIKIDFLTAEPHQRRDIAARHGLKKKLLAENV